MQRVYEIVYNRVEVIGLCVCFQALVRSVDANGIGNSGCRKTFPEDPHSL